MESEVARAAIDATGSSLLVCIVSATDLGGTGQLLRHLVGDTSGVNVNNATDCTGSVEQGRWTFQDLDALRDKRIDGDRVVWAGNRDVQAIDSVFRGFYAGATEASNYGTTNRLPKAGGVDARHVLKRFAE